MPKTGDDREGSDEVRLCEICGEPIYSRARVHPKCAGRAGKPPATRKTPKKVCPVCGDKSHVRKLICDNCGTMF